MGQPSSTCPFSTIATPLSLIAKRPASSSGSSPIRNPAGTATFLSTTQRLRAASGPTWTPGNRIESTTRAPRSTKAPFPTIDRATCAPEMIEPWQSRLAPTSAGSPPSPGETLAGGKAGWWVRTGQASL